MQMGANNHKDESVGTVYDFCLEMIKWSWLVWPSRSLVGIRMIIGLWGLQSVKSRYPH